MIAAAAGGETAVDVLADYEDRVAALPVTLGARRDRVCRARRFMSVHRDLDVWMQRPTVARLADLRRAKAWPFVTWLFVSGRRRPDLELLLAKPAGCDLPSVWAAAHPDGIARVEQMALGLGWSKNWTRQVVVLAASMICVWADKAIDGLHDADFDAIVAELDRSPAVTASARTRLKTRLFSLRHICFQLGICDVAPRLGQPPARSAAQHAATIPQPAIAREAVRYAETISTVLRPSTVQMRIKSVRVLCDWLADHHPDIERLDQLDRTVHIEPFIAWARTRPCRGNNGRGRTVSPTQFHHDLVDLRVFFEDITEWGWASQPNRRLFFLADLPRLPAPLPRALPPSVDRDLMAAVEHLDDDFARTGIILLRATGMRISELLDLELDCLVTFGTHGTWLKVPIGKLGTERMVPLDPAPLAALDAWITNRDRQRPLPHPRDGRLCDFVFTERGRRPGAHRIRRALQHAADTAGLTGPDRQPLRVVPHQLRHTFGTELVNAGMSLPALMALLGHVTPEMTLRYAQLASPTVRAAYDTAMNKVRARRPIHIVPAGRTTAIPAKVDWLHTEMIKTRVAHGFCSRHPIAGACTYSNICEQCDNFVPDPAREPVIAEQLDDIRTLRDDAHQRGWTDEAARHDRVIQHLEQHLTTTRHRNHQLTATPKAG